MAVMPSKANRGSIDLLHSDFEHRAIAALTISSVSVRARGKVP